MFSSPRIKGYSQDNVWAAANSSIQLDCHFTAPTRQGIASVVWKKDDFPLYNSVHYAIKNFSSPETNTVSSMLTIDIVADKDEGIYSCYCLLNKSMVTSRQPVLSGTRHIHLRIGEEEESMCLHIGAIVCLI